MPHRIALAALAILASLSSCRGPDSEGSARDAGPEDALFRVGTVVVREADLQHRLRENHGGKTDEASRKAALAILVKRARFTQAALDAGIADEAFVRDEVSRLLAARLRETQLDTRLKEIPEVSEERLREIYQDRLARYQAPEQRRVAVLWLNPGPDPERAARYEEKMTKARAFVLQDRDLRENPGKGFSVLGADHSEHQPSRFRGGILGWMQREGGPDAWTKAVAEIAFSLENKGDVSEVITREEGIFLVRVTDIKSGVTRSFESMAAGLERAERQRLRREIEDAFEDGLAERYPVEWIEPAPPPDGDAIRE
ncbi:MAG: hypothetical protein HKO57_16060 [Akkermansiaceae bacterium]|nr:hypothetical protein [Akkermansiaceae bacterium]